MLTNKDKEIIIARAGADLTDKEIENIKEMEISNVDLTSRTGSFKTDLATHLDEKPLYEIYKQMDNDAIISAALNLFADTATQVAANGHVVTIVSPDKVFEEEINEFLWKEVKIDTEAWNYVRTIAQYGKLILDTEASNNGGEWAFTEIQALENVIPLTYGQNNIKYYAVKQDEKDENKLDDYWKTSGTNNAKYTIEPKSRYISGFNGRKYLGEMVIETNNHLFKEGKTEETLNMRAGRSLLQDVVSTWQALMTLEDALILNRLTKSTAFNLVSIDVGNSTNKEATAMINEVRKTLNSSESIDAKSNRYNNRQSPIPVNDYVIVPTKGEKGAVTITQVGGEISSVPMEDINYLRNKLIGGLGMLKAYVGFEETTPGGLGDTTLTMLDEKLGRTVKRLRTSLVDVINQQVEYYWINSSLARSLGTLPEYEIELGPLSTLEDQAAREEIGEKIVLASSYQAFLADFPNMVNEEKLFKWLVGEVVGIDLSKIDNSPDNKEITVELKQLDEIKTQVLTERNKTTYQSNKIKKSRLEKVRKVNKRVGKQKDFIKQVPALLENTELYLNIKGKEIPLNALNKNTLQEVLNRRVLGEATYKQLKQKTNITDPLRIAKSKKITGTYEGLDTDGNISFIVTAEDPSKNKKEGKPTSYITSVDLKDLFKIVDDRKKGQNDLSLVQNAMQGNIAVACECPASMYWGQQYNGTKEGYSIVKNDIAPERNTPTQVICKHVAATLTWLPFWTNTIVKDLRNLDILPNHTQLKIDRQQEEDLIKEISNMKDIEEPEIEVEVEVDEVTQEPIETSSKEEIITNNIKQTIKKPGSKKEETTEGEEEQ